MRIYATPSDLMPDWLDEIPANATRLIRAASVMVEDTTRLALYATDTQGLPTEPEVIEAFRDAVCNQVAIWHAGELDPNAGAAGQALYVKSQTVDGGSVTLEGHVSVEERTKAATGLDNSTLMILRNAGLLTPSVESLAAGEIR